MADEEDKKVVAPDGLDQVQYITENPEAQKYIA